MDNILAAGTLIATARRARMPLEPLPEDLVPADEAAGDKIQDAINDLLATDCGPLAGHKIGGISLPVSRP